MLIVGTLTNLKFLHIDLLQPQVGKMYLPELLKLRNLNCLRLDGFPLGSFQNGFNLDHFKQITENSKLLTDISFPRGTPWANDEFLQVLKATHIRKILPWMYIGENDRAEADSYTGKISFLLKKSNQNS